MAALRHVLGGRRAGSAGFTLVEVLVALTVMAVLAGLAWRGVDGMVRARDATAQAVDRAARLNTILAQWQQDFDALHDSGVVPALQFDGRTLRLTRRVDSGPQGGGVAVVAWSLADGVWRRWASEPLARRDALQQAWLASQQLLGSEPRQVRLLEGVTGWQLYYYRGNAWSNAQSSADVEAGAGPDAAAPREALPDGVRLVVETAAGTLTRDIVVAPGASS